MTNTFSTRTLTLEHHTAEEVLEHRVKKCRLGHFHRKGGRFGGTWGVPRSKMKIPAPLLLFRAFPQYNTLKKIIVRGPATGQLFAPRRFLTKIEATASPNRLFRKFEKIMEIGIKGVFQPTKYRLRKSPTAVSKTLDGCFEEFPIFSISVQ